VVKKDECPLHIKKLFENWRRHPKNNILQNIILEFYEWHCIDNYSFSSNRQILLWLNYKLWQHYGNVVMLVNFEHFFYNQWNKENRSGGSSIINFIDFIKSQIDTVKAELKTLYREQIGFNQLNAIQKIANNYLFNQNFKIQLPTDKTEAASTLAKAFTQKGFITLEDIPNQLLNSKQIEILQNWVENKSISIAITEDEWVAYINPKSFSQSRLEGYNNLHLEKETINWENLVAMKPKLKIIQEELKPKIEIPTFEITDTNVRKSKAFFG
jgi:hypothetical protein